MAFRGLNVQFKVDLYMVCHRSQLHMTTECNKDMASPALLERRRRNNENEINRKIYRMLQEEKMRKIITELSREMTAWKKKWLDLARTNEKTWWRN